MNKETLKEYLSSRYQGWNSFLNHIIFPIFGEDDFEDLYETELLDNQPERRHLAEATGIRSVKEIGKMTIGAEPLYIYDVTVGDRVMMERNRVNIQRLIRSVMDKFSCAFILFHYENDTRWDWRFTYCRMGANDKDATDSKRYTFLLGPGQSCRTVAENFLKLAEKREDIEIADIEKAFSVEALSDEFFSKYKAQYEKFVCFITGKKYVKAGNKYEEKVITDPHPVMYDAFNRNDKLVRDYIKQMLGRITFLHFLQKKGWMGVPEGGQWGGGDLQFMRHLFTHATDEQKENFLDAVLEPLYDKGLDTDRSADDDLFDTGVALEQGCRVRIPYLNGGLFERNSLDEIATQFPAGYFAELFDFFYQYNFTIDENDPNETQVGVDPEMLGRIFENLLEDNKDKGAYYTPKEIVRYMCRQSLIAYLQTGVDSETDRKAIASFVENYDAALLPASLVTHIDERLKAVKVCDPAIGSGAFPMGMLKEIFLCRGAIENFDNAADIKRHIIQNNIYGVDIERGAVDIARLRFWLSLVVDEQSPETLPNLDFKIMQGNSLLEQYEGIDLSKLATDSRQLLSETKTLEIFDSMLDIHRMKLRKLIDQYYSETNHVQKHTLLQAINENISNQLNEARINIDLSDIDIQSNTQFFLWHTWFADVLSRPSGCNGFDIVIGNPPYGAKLSNEDKRTFKKLFVTAKTIGSIQKGSLDTYTLFIEQSFNLLVRNGCLSMIVPISITSSDSLSGIHRLLLRNCEDIHISSYAVRPQPVFKNAVVNTSIISLRKTNQLCQHIYSTKMYRKGRNFNLQTLINNLQFAEVNEFLLFGRIPKISLEIERNILRKIFRYDKLETYVDSMGLPIFYRSTGGRYFKIVTNYSTGSTKEKAICFKQDFATAIGAILSSNLSFWFYQIYSNNLDWKSYEIEQFTSPTLNKETVKELTRLYNEYLADVEKNARTRHTSEESSYKMDSFKEYKIGKSKSIIDKIDDLICPLYGLTQEETDFIKNYEIEFRLSDDE